ncbi:MAG: exonuclease domain-containing protein, partial [Coriobacteriia bacterium]|nr:exonuclease domain-containing protein [Coriobacteriia bacterium]
MDAIDTAEVILQLLIPGTDADVLAKYATLAKRAKDEVFGAFEEDIVTLDVETTGLSYQRDTLIEIAAVRIRGTEIVDQYSTFVDPGRAIPLNITELTGISDDDVTGAPDALTAIVQLAEFVGSTTVVAHNSEFDRNMLRHATRQVFDFIENNSWVDSIQLARIALPRCRSYSLQSLTEVFCEARSTHRAIDDALRLAELWRVMLTALTDLPYGLVRQIADLFPDSEWALRPHIAQVAGSIPEPAPVDGLLSPASTRPASTRFSLLDARRARMQQRPRQNKQDALELIGGRSTLTQVDARQVMAAFTADGLLGQMYPQFEPRQEQTQMALGVAAALSTSTHLAVEAGTGVGKSMAYLLPLALFARANDICCGVATKTNTLLDQLLYSELPRLNKTLPGGIVFESLKGYDHYPCLRKLASLSRQTERIASPNSITTIASLLSFVCQSSRGDMDHLRMNYEDVSRYELVASADDCLKRRCRYYTACLLHGARRAAAEADIVLTNQALLFCDITAEGSILPNIRHWVIDEAHSAEDEARDQLSFSVSPRDLASSIEMLISGHGILSILKAEA